jgi:hypothetical protein
LLHFDPEAYRLNFGSRGDTALSKRVVQLFRNPQSHPEKSSLWSVIFPYEGIRV